FAPPGSPGTGDGACPSGGCGLEDAGSRSLGDPASAAPPGDPSAPSCGLASSPVGRSDLPSPEPPSAGPAGGCRFIAAATACRLATASAIPGELASALS